MDETQSNITDSIRALSAVRRDNQHTLAEIMGISQSSVGAKLVGKVRWTVADLTKLATHYGTTIDQLTAGPWAWLQAAARPGSVGGDNVRYPALGASELDGPAEFPPIESTLVAA